MNEELDDEIIRRIRAGKSLSTFQKKDLIESAKRLDLPISGNKTDLITRIQARLAGDSEQSSTLLTNHETSNEKAMRLFCAGEPLSKLLLSELKDVLKHWRLPVEKTDKKIELILRLSGYFSEIIDRSGAPTCFPVSSLPNGDDASISVLMVAEKPIMASQIAKQLAKGARIFFRRATNDCKVHEFDGQFMNRRAHFKMTSTFGHIMKQGFPAEYQNWHAHEPLSLFSCPVEKMPCDPKTKMKKFLADEAKDCDYLVLWLDCDAEGENICFEVIDAVRKSLRKHKKSIDEQIFRAHFSALNEVESAMRALIRPNYKQALSVDAKKELDLRIGVAFSRFQTLYFRKQMRDRDVKLVSFGPCQTPTLAFCVEQHEKVIAFRSDSSYVVSCTLNVNDGLAPMKVDYIGPQLSSEDTARELLKKVKTSKLARLIKVETKQHEKAQPKAMNTLELLKAASTRLHISPSETMRLAQTLYQRGYISYPRTETTVYPTQMALADILRKCAGGLVERWSNGSISVRDLGESFETRKGEDKGDHPPIYPISAPDHTLSNDELRLHEYICQHFTATLMKPCTYETFTLSFSVCDEAFRAQTRRLIDRGFTCIMSEQCVTVDDDRLFLGLQIGSDFQITDVKIVSKKASPPTHLTESELISKMEQYSIGTDASIPTHIENILKSYVKLDKNRRLVPTALGVALIHAYRELDPDLTEPTVRADTEQKLSRIALGECDHCTVRDEILDFYRSKFVAFTATFNRVEMLFRGCFPPRAACGGGGEGEDAPPAKKQKDVSGKSRAGKIGATHLSAKELRPEAIRYQQTEGFESTNSRRNDVNFRKHDQKIENFQRNNNVWGYYDTSNPNVYHQNNNRNRNCENQTYLDRCLNNDLYSGSSDHHG